MYVVGVNVCVRVSMYMCVACVYVCVYVCGGCELCVRVSMYMCRYGARRFPGGCVPGVCACACMYVGTFICMQVRFMIYMAECISNLHVLWHIYIHTYIHILRYASTFHDLHDTIN
jgi:hypothetical protein